MRRSIALGALATAGAVFFVAPARANDPAAAESLFVEAQKLLAAGNADAACPKLEESQRLDPTGATALSLARCLEQTGKIASAWARYQEALEFARKKGAASREKEIEARLATISPTVPKLVVVVSPEAAKIAELRVVRGDTQMGAGQWGSPLAVDPGPLTLVASAPGRRSWTSELTIEKGRTTAITVPVLELELEPPPTVASATPTATPSPAVSTTSPPLAPARDDRTWGYLATGAGVALAAVGGYFVWRRATYGDDAERLCGTSSGGADNHARALEKSRDSGRAGTFALAAFGASTATLGLGIYLLVRPVGRVALAPMLRHDGATASLSGSF